MIYQLIQVAEFHRTFKHPILREAKFPSEERCKLRANLIAEELQELRDAIDKKDFVGAADALTDIQYVLFGAVLEFGLAPMFTDLFNEVHRSNMSKVCETEDEALATMQYYRAKYGIGSRMEKADDGRWLVFREPDNKTLKSIKYSRADLEGIIKQFANGR